MGKYNTTISYKNVVPTYEGGTAYQKNPLEDWMNFLCSSFMENRYYESAGSQMHQFIDLTKDVYVDRGPEFVAKMAVFSRNVLGMRSVSQIVAAYLNGRQFEGKRNFFHNFCHRPDDIGEMLALIENVYEDKISHGFLRGCKDYLEDCSIYTLTKYQMNHKAWRLCDIINVTHAHSDAIAQYKRREYESPDTWEAKISVVKDPKEKNEEWMRLLIEHKLGYLALIRNLRHLMQAARENGYNLNAVVEQIGYQLTNRTAIQKSLVFPFQIYNAYKNFVDMPSNLAAALEEAFALSTDNIPELPGKTLIIQDVSGSMDCPVSKNSTLTIKELGACYATMLLTQNPNCDIIKFGSEASLVDKGALPFQSFHTIYTLTQNQNLGYGTNVRRAFQIIPQAYDRIFLISDMQCMDHNGINIYNDYCRNFSCSPHLYSFDLGNYRMQFANPNNPRVHLLTALNDSLLTMIPYIENSDKLAWDIIAQQI